MPALPYIDGVDILNILGVPVLQHRHKSSGGEVVPDLEDSRTRPPAPRICVGVS